MAPSSFASANIKDVVAQLTSEEAITLIAGVGFWHTAAIPRLGIPAIKVSDGPNGIRGNHFFMGTPAKCLPSATALGATWDTELVGIVGKKLLAAEAKLRQASVILAPTCNIQRSPLGGRSFESFSEDPILSGLIAAAYVNGVQADGIGTTIKHFVTNDKENDRMAYDTILTPRALRELYLMPFMLAEKHAKPWSYMTAYNRTNGTHLSENPAIIKDILRDEWKSEAMLMSDWFGVYSIDLSINAGLDLEMPGTDKWRTIEKTTRSINSRKTMLRTVKKRAEKVLELVQKCAQGAPEVLDGDGIERTYEGEEDTALLRKVAGESIVLLKNENSLLPLDPASLKGKKVAIVGGNAKAVILSGGGSASLKPSYFVSPYDGIVKALGGDVHVSYGEGARTALSSPLLDWDLVTKDGERGWIGSWYNNGPDGLQPHGAPVATRLIDETLIFVSVSQPKELGERWTLMLEGFLKPRDHDQDFEFGLSVSGRAKLFVDDQLVIDNWTRQRRGDFLFGSGTKEEKGVFTLKAGVSHAIRVQFCNVSGPADGDEDETPKGPNSGVRLGGAAAEKPEDLETAVELAKEADVAIVVVGLNGDWETEGYDRTTLALPGKTDELVKRVAAVNKNTVVVTQSGSAITMPWVNDVPSIVHAWYLGNATGDAIADVLFGKVNPAGKLSLTFPKRLEDVPSYGHFHSENGKVFYGEDLFVGYKHYQHKSIETLFPFGYGLSYSSFTYDNVKVSKPTFKDGDVHVAVSVTITNTSKVAGSEAVQVYVSHPQESPLTQVPLALRGFAKVRDLQPGKSQTVEVALDKYAFSYWEERIKAWTVDAGEYGVHVGPSSATLPLQGAVVVGAAEAFEWNGL